MGVSVNSDCATIKTAFIGGDEYGDSDIEMITFEGSPYTSLKDIIESSSPSSSPTSWMIASPNKQGSGGDGSLSWREIPIKDPLVQHAAWAYLLPMSGGDGGEHHRSFTQKVRDQCCGVFGCLNGVVALIVKNWKV